MLCEFSTHFLVIWFGMSALGLLLMFLMSGSLFVYYYAKPSFEKWRQKSNPNYPAPELVKNEIIQMCKGMLAGTFCPALCAWLGQQGLSKAYCGVGDRGWGYLIATFFAIWLATDLWETIYHYMGHTISFLWNQHKYHHTFYNPSPFAVVADEYFDQLIRSAPLLLFPMIAPVNLDLIFFTFGVFFYGYGVYLHWGHEFTWLDAHHPHINTSYQHYLHHAKSINKKPYHTGFFLKLWDKILGSLYDGRCDCAKCCCQRGERTKEAYEKVEKPDYSVLLKTSFWLK